MESGGVTADLPEANPELYDAVRDYIHDRGEEVRRQERAAQAQQRGVTYG